MVTSPSSAKCLFTALLLLIYKANLAHAFQTNLSLASSPQFKRFALYSSLPPTHAQEQTYSSIPPLHPLSPLIAAALSACEPRRLDTNVDAHEAFRYEWGTWCDENKLENLMGVLGDVRLKNGYGDILGDTKNGNSCETSSEIRNSGRRLRVAGGKYWDVILHLLPKNS